MQATPLIGNEKRRMIKWQYNFLPLTRWLKRLAFPAQQRIIKRLNQELENKGYITVSGKVSKKYFADRFYGGAELMKPQPYVLNERRVA